MKKIVTICTISAMLLVSLFAITGCKNKEENKEENTQKNEVIEETNRAEENTVNNNQNTTYSDPQKVENNTVEQKESTTKASDDKTPIDINDSKSYYFVVNGKKYFAGDKISDLASSEFTLNKTGSEKELAANGYLIGGGAVLNSDKKTVFNITPFNNTKEKIKGADAFIGGFSLNKSNYDLLKGEIAVYGGITIGSSLDDVTKVFGEPTKKTEATEYVGPTYTYDAKESYRDFTISFDKDNTVKTLNWRNFTFNK
ncbi:MAG: hypothetical protein U0O04_08150 [Clostridia bacterium]|jgi:hypothetical protein|nr:hypothetical protein [Clostridiaceae bacterium]